MPPGSSSCSTSSGCWTGSSSPPSGSPRHGGPARLSPVRSCPVARPLKRPTRKRRRRCRTLRLAQGSVPQSLRRRRSPVKRTFLRRPCPNGAISENRRVCHWRVTRRREEHRPLPPQLCRAPTSLARAAPHRDGGGGGAEGGQALAVPRSGGLVPAHPPRASAPASAGRRWNAPGSRGAPLPGLPLPLSPLPSPRRRAYPRRNAPPQRGRQ